MVLCVYMCTHTHTHAHDSNIDALLTHRVCHTNDAPSSSSIIMFGCGSGAGDAPSAAVDAYDAHTSTKVHARAPEPT